MEKVLRMHWYFKGTFYGGSAEEPIEVRHEEYDRYEIGLKILDEAHVYALKHDLRLQYEDWWGREPCEDENGEWIPGCRYVGINIIESNVFDDEDPMDFTFFWGDMMKAYGRGKL